MFYESFEILRIFSYYGFISFIINVPQMLCYVMLCYVMF